MIKNFARVLVAVLSLATVGCAPPKPDPNYPPGAETCPVACAHVGYDLKSCGMSERLCNDHCVDVARNNPAIATCLALAFSCMDLWACDPQK